LTVRSRPKVKVLLSPPVVLPAGRLVTEVILDARSETPMDFVSVFLDGRFTLAVGSGNARSVSTSKFFAKEWRSKAEKLSKGEHRYRVAFDLPPDAPPSYEGTNAWIRYILTVHVSIPWWPDRTETFAVPVGFTPPERVEPQPVSFATSTDGPRGTTPYVEVALATAQLAVGDVLTGSVSVANLRGRRVRGIDVAFVEVETTRVPAWETREARRFALRIHDGPPPDGESLPFRVRVPERATPTFRSGPFQLTTHVEIRADVALGQDVVIRSPVHIVPRVGPARETGWVAPIGRERRALVWRAACERVGLANDPEEERMFGARGPVAVEIRTEQRDQDFWLVAKLGWPALGLELALRERRWTDVLGLDAMPTGDAKSDRRFAVHAREHAQAGAFLTADLLRLLVPFEEVTLDDTGAVLAMRGAAHTTERVLGFVTAALAASDAIAGGHGRVPVPALFAADEPAWRALTERLRGRFEPGRMWIHDGQLGTDGVSVGSVWASASVVATSVRVAVDPPLPRVPAAPEDPEVSPAARATWKELTGLVKTVHVDAAEIVCELPGRLPDPQTALPVVELAIALRRALGGVVAAGPFR
jgi:hypothetical protein